MARDHWDSEALILFEHKSPFEAKNFKQSLFINYEIMLNLLEAR